jgi:hypothetical protein
MPQSVSSNEAHCWTSAHSSQSPHTDLLMPQSFSSNEALCWASAHSSQSPHTDGDEERIPPPNSLCQRVEPVIQVGCLNDPPLPGSPWLHDNTIFRDLFLSGIQCYIVNGDQQTAIDCHSDFAETGTANGIQEDYQTQSGCTQHVLYLFCYGR